LATYPELKKDLIEIESSLHIYAQAAAKTAPSVVKSKVMDELRNEFVADTKPGTNGWKYLAFALGLGMLLFGYFFLQRNNESNILQREIHDLRDTCQTREQVLTQRIELLQQLTSPGNRILPFSATPAFASTDLYLHHNQTTGRNFIQVRSLPQIREDQTFELWSIKPGQAPARLDLFEAPADGLVEVQFVEGTEVYAITIEPDGGVDSPTMENLIGTVAVGDLK
jgi:hypothetical protein